MSTGQMVAMWYGVLVVGLALYVAANATAAAVALFVATLVYSLGGHHPRVNKTRAAQMFFSPVTAAVAYSVLMCVIGSVSPKLMQRLAMPTWPAFFWSFVVSMFGERPNWERGAAVGLGVASSMESLQAYAGGTFDLDQVAISTLVGALVGGFFGAQRAAPDRDAGEVASEA
jgi:hypothetical protein